MNRVTVEVNGREADLTFDLAAVTNQAGWTLNQAGCTQAQTDIRGWLAVAGGVGAGATEATLISVLAAINNTNQDIEILLVRQISTGDVLQQITDWQSGTPIVTYKDVDGTVVPTPGAVEYLDPSAVMNLILSAIQAQGLVPQSTEATLELVRLLLVAIDGDTSNLDVALSTRASEVTLAALSDKLNSLGRKASAASAPVVLSTEQEAILATINSVLDAIKLDTANISTDPATEATLSSVKGELSAISAKVALETTQIAVKDAVEAIKLNLDATIRASFIQRVTAAGTYPAGSRSVSFSNDGDLDCLVGLVAIHPGQSITFDAGGENDTLGSIDYDASQAGGDLLITATI